MSEFYKHIFLSSDNITSEKYTTPLRGGGEPNIPSRNRASHSSFLLQKFDEIWNQRTIQNQQRGAENIPTREGTYLSFISAANHDLTIKSLEDLRKGIRLLNVKEVRVDDEYSQIRATVYIPRGKEAHFIEKINKYQSETTPKGEPKNSPLIDSIEDISIALLESLWTDNLQLIPNQNAKWCEVWLNVNTKESNEQEQITSFKTTLSSIGIEYKPNSIIFPERAILLINANNSQLIELMLRSDLLAEFRAGQEPAGFWVNESISEQQRWIDDLLQRIEILDSNVKVCVLDTGVNNGHQLLEPILDDNNTLSVNSAWGTNDHEPRTGHGTLMAGIAGYGNLEEVLITAENIRITHTLCSVKILPPPSQDATPKELWGDITAQGISRAEIQNPGGLLIYCMAITSMDDVNKGRPSSWSGEIDNLAYGDGESKRLIIISAGNMKNYYPNLDDLIDYPAINYSTSIQNPAQSWNALTVGAFTEKIKINDSSFDDYETLAGEGELSPHSTTSLIWERKWPIKPEVVFEGGNLIKSPSDNSIESHEDLELLTTSKTFNTRPFDTINATSSATAQASWFASKIAYEYPDAWMETIRGLVIHSANWNDAMKNQLDVRPNNRGDYNKLLRVFGYGKPDLTKALYSQESALTFIAQEYIKPFVLNGSRGETNDIHIYNLPWPEDLLLSLGATPVKLKISLSYFIQPGAGEIGWKDKYRYQSHAFRFDVNNVGEDLDSFKKRINVETREEDEQITGNSGSNRWAIGKDNHSCGSIHSDYWEGTAADLATCHFIAVYPVIGWWRERKHLGQVDNTTRYSLIISLETPLEEIELYTTVKNMIEIPIEIKT
jgi:hypothetical protein